MSRALIVARLSLLETARRQFYLLTLFIAFGLFVLPAVVSVFGITASARVVKDVSLTVMGGYAVVLAVFLGATIVPGEIERRTAFPILARPMSRAAWLWGKWLGLVGFVVLSLMLIGAVHCISASIFLETVEWSVWEAITLYGMEAGVLAAVCMWFSVFSSPALAAVLGFAVYILGGLSDAFIDTFSRPAEGIHMPASVMHFLKGCLPDFQLFQNKNAVVHGDAIPLPYFWSVIAYGIAWIAFLHLLAAWSFERKDL